MLDELRLDLYFMDWLEIQLELYLIDWLVIQSLTKSNFISPYKQNSLVITNFLELW